MQVIVALVAFAVAAGLAPQRSSSITPSTRWALVVSESPRGTGGPGVDRIVEVLTQQYGYTNVLRLTGEDATLGRIYSNLSLLQERVGRSDAVFVYVSLPSVRLGRGVEGEQYLRPADARPDQPWGLIAVSELLGRIGTVRAGATLAVFDECLDIGGGALLSANQAKQNYAQSRVPNQAFHVLSGCPAGAFREALVEALGADAGKVPERLTVDDVAKRIEAKLARRVVLIGSGNPFTFVPERTTLAPELMAGLDRTNSREARLAALDRIVQAVLRDSARQRETLKTEAGTRLVALSTDTSDDGMVRAAAITALGTLQYEPAVPRLAWLLSSTQSPAIHVAAVGALDRIGGTSTTEPLERAISSPSTEARAAAIRALARRGSPQSIPLILRQLGVEAQEAPALAGLEAIGLLKVDADRAVPAVLTLLSQSTLPVVQASAINTLGALGSARSEPQVLRYLQTRDDQVRAAAAFALGLLEGGRGTAARERALIEALKDRSADVREAAAQSLGRLKADAAIGPLIELLTTSGAASARAAAALALGSLGSDLAADPLMAALKDDSEAVRRAAATALGTIQLPAAVSQLQEVAANDRDPYVRGAAQAALQRIKRAPLDDLKSPDPRVRALALGRIVPGSTDAIAAVEMLGDPDQGVRAAATVLLAQATSDEVLSRLIQVLDDTRDGSRFGSPERQGAALALGPKPQRAAIDALRRHLEDRDDLVRLAVLRALGTSADPEATLALLNATLSPNPRVKAAAADALSAQGVLVYDSGDYLRAVRVIEQALRTRSDILGPTHPDVATDLNNLGVIHQKTGQLDRAEQRLLEALRIRENALGPNHLETAITLSNLALVYMTKRDFKQAESLYFRALRIREEALPPGHELVVSSLENLSNLYKAGGQIEEAERYRIRAEQAKRQPKSVK